MKKKLYLIFVCVMIYIIGGKLITNYVFKHSCNENQNFRKEEATLTGLFWPIVFPLYIMVELPCEIPK